MGIVSDATSDVGKASELVNKLMGEMVMMVYAINCSQVEFYQDMNYSA